MTAKNNFSISEERRRILLVEDDYVNQETLKATLVDVYEIVIAEIGEEALCDLVDELNTQGYKQLRISEDGDVTITAKGGERCFAAIDRFPPKTVWEDLCMLLRQDDIKASISGSQIAIAW